MTKISFENENGKYMVEVDKEDMYLTEIICDLLIPVLLAAGYHYENIKEVMRQIGE